MGEKEPQTGASQTPATGSRSGSDPVAASEEEHPLHALNSTAIGLITKTTPKRPPPGIEWVVTALPVRSGRENRESLARNTHPKPEAAGVARKNRDAVARILLWTYWLARKGNGGARRTEVRRILGG